MQSVEFNSVVEALERAEASVSAAECHGMLTAQLSMASGKGAAECVRHIFVDNCDPSSVLFTEALSVLEQMISHIHTTLNDPDMGFELLLPDEKISMPDRLLSLSEWCQGYLFGLGLAGVSDNKDISSDINEMLQDLVHISHLDLEQAFESEENEKDYVELVEYVRIGVLYLQEECRDLNTETGQ
ncbi:hypothetical protein MNBD_GAMMA12-750 [hydrothermal vent metagenome]|uniref:YecA family protein n=1 Tax=hydrothermal vent metagenome TaxID=652676 RepID=A0A3B0Y615_9ZZZZ